MFCQADHEITQFVFFTLRVLMGATCFYIASKPYPSGCGTLGFSEICYNLA